MNPVDDYHRFYCGSKVLYDKVRKRQPVFLQRNLRKVLDHHEHSLNSSKNPSTNTTSDLPATDMLPNNEPRHLPSKNMLSAATKPKQQTLIVHPTHILKKRWNSDGERRELSLGPVAKPVSSNPTWLPAPGHIRIRCNVHCHIHAHDPEKLSPLLHTSSRLAYINVVEDDRGEFDIFIDMKPFKITEEQMLTTQLANHNANGDKIWRRTKRPPQLMLNLAIDCFNSEDASQLLSVIDPHTKLETILSPAQAQLRAYWKLSTLPIPPLSSLLRYQHEPNDQAPHANTRQMDYVLEAHISWNPGTKSSKTPLAMCNHVAQMLEPKSRQPPTTTHHPQTCHITYVFDGGPMGSRVINHAKLSCVLCPDRLPYPTFDRLHFHYLSFHDHFTYKVHKSVTSDSGSLMRTVFIELAVPKYERASDNVCDEREITWVKPEAPFDLQQYLLEGGSNTWASTKQLPLKSFPKTAKPSFMSKGVARPKIFSTNGQLTLTPPDRQPKVGPPADVKEVPSRKRKRYLVPNIPDVTIFRAEAKREVKPGEGLSESDAEPDDTWLRIKHGIEDFPQLTGAARHFATLFDGHLLQDEPRNLANVHVGEAVVRFVRRFAVQLRQPHLRQELKLKLHELKDMDLISDEYVDYCLALVAEGEQGHINGGPAIKEEFPSQHSRIPPSTNLPGHNTLDIIMIDDSDSEPGAEVSPATFPQTKDDDTDMQDAVYHAPNVCVCGKVALGSHKVISCQNIVSLSLDRRWTVD